MQLNSELFLIQRLPKLRKKLLIVTDGVIMGGRGNEIEGGCPRSFPLFTKILSEFNIDFLPDYS